MAYGGQRFLSNDEILKLLQSVDSDDSFDIEPDSDDEDNYQPIINEELSSSDDNSGEDIESSEQPHTNEHILKSNSGTEWFVQSNTFFLDVLQKGTL